MHNKQYLSIHHEGKYHYIINLLLSVVRFCLLKFFLFIYFFCSRTELIVKCVSDGKKYLNGELKSTTVYQSTYELNSDDDEIDFGKYNI